MKAKVYKLWEYGRELENSAIVGIDVSFSFNGGGVGSVKHVTSSGKTAYALNEHGVNILPVLYNAQLKIAGADGFIVVGVCEEIFNNKARMFFCEWNVVPKN